MQIGSHKHKCPYFGLCNIFSDYIIGLLAHIYEEKRRRIWQFVTTASKKKPRTNLKIPTYRAHLLLGVPMTLSDKGDIFPNIQCSVLVQKQAKLNVFGRHKDLLKAPAKRY